MRLNEHMTIEAHIACCGKGDIADSFYVVFRKGMKAEETLRFIHRPSGDRMLIDRGDDGYPIAAQVISADGIEFSRSSASEADCRKEAEQAIRWLFTFATEMLRYNEVQLQKKGNALVEDAVGYLRRMPREAVELCEAS